MARKLPANLAELRADAKRDVLAIIAGEIDRIQVDGFWGAAPVALDVQDGLVVTVRAKGCERTYKLPLDRAA